MVKTGWKGHSPKFIYNTASTAIIMAEGSGIDSHALENKIREQSKWLKNASNGLVEASARCTRCWDYGQSPGVGRERM